MMNDVRCVMYNVRCAVCIVLLLALSACWGKKDLPEDKAKAVLKEALSTLQSGNVDGYMRYVDFGSEMDSVQLAVMQCLLKQHLDRQTQRKGTVVSIETVDAQLVGDSVCTVFCQLAFADSTVEVVSQKMVRVGETWKIRLRN
ncbi:MAG: DUF4878 domain-containing protein [Bacteroidaceae bacterium]|nr:DUF4878 domain-containing protein [Bacteroidaceae bacterium]